MAKVPLATRGRAAASRAGSVETPDRPIQLSLSAAEPQELTESYTVHLPGFDGPMDLLLNLIEKNQLEIITISLVAVTDQFVSYLRMWDEPPLPRLADFVAMAARLLLIKSRSLLPRLTKVTDDDDSDPLDDAEVLAQRLREYQLAREIARSLRARELAGLQSFTRAARLVDPELMLTWAPPKLVGLNVNALASIFKRVLTEQKFSQPEQLPLPLVTVAEKIEEIEALLATHSPLTLEEALRTATSRFAMVVTFLAVLELWHQGRLEVTQEELFGPVYIVPGPRSRLRVGEHGASTEDDAPIMSEFDPTPLAPLKTKK